MKPLAWLARGDASRSSTKVCRQGAWVSVRFPIQHQGLPTGSVGERGSSTLAQHLGPLTMHAPDRVRYNFDLDEASRSGGRHRRASQGLSDAPKKTPSCEAHMTLCEYIRCWSTLWRKGCLLQAPDSLPLLRYAYRLFSLASLASLRRGHTFAQRRRDFGSRLYNCTAVRLCGVRRLAFGLSVGLVLQRCLRCGRSFCLRRACRSPPSSSSPSPFLHPARQLW